jgi:hypothetical protein
MTNEITTTNSPELIRQAQALSGASGYNSVPFIPIITINNKTTEKETLVDNVLTTVVVPARKGFNITTKNDQNVRQTDFYAEELTATILRIRYTISSKNKVSPRFYCREFDRFDEIIKVYDENNQVILEGNYAELKRNFATGELNSVGKPKVAFDLIVILYISIDGSIYKLRLNNASRSDLFDYLKTFSQEDVFTAYKTKFNLEYNQEGSIKFWHVKFERGESVDLAPEIELQKELQKYFAIASAIKTPDYSQPEIPDENVIEYDKPSDEIKINQIPF